MNHIWINPFGKREPHDFMLLPIESARDELEEFIGSADMYELSYLVRDTDTDTDTDADRDRNGNIRKWTAWRVTSLEDDLVALSESGCTERMSVVVWCSKELEYLNRSNLDYPEEYKQRIETQMTQIFGYPLAAMNIRLYERLFFGALSESADIAKLVAQAQKLSKYTELFHNLHYECIELYNLHLDVSDVRYTCDCDFDGCERHRGRQSSGLNTAKSRIVDINNQLLELEA